MNKFTKGSVVEEFSQYLKAIKEKRNGKDIFSDEKIEKVFELLDKVPSARQYRELKGLFSSPDMDPFFVKILIYKVAEVNKQNAGILNLCKSHAAVLGDNSLSYSLLLLENPNDIKAAKSLMTFFADDRDFEKYTFAKNTTEGVKSIISAVKNNAKDPSFVKHAIEMINKYNKNDECSRGRVVQLIGANLVEANPTDARIIDFGFKEGYLTLLARGNKHNPEVLSRVIKEAEAIKRKHPEHENGIKGRILSEALDLRVPENAQRILGYARESHNMDRVDMLINLAKACPNNPKLASEILNVKLFSTGGGDLNEGAAISEVYSAVLENNPRNKELRKQALMMARKYLHHSEIQGHLTIEEFIKNVENSTQSKDSAWERLKQKIGKGKNA